MAKPFVFCNNLKGLVEEICKLRGTPTHLVKLGIDGRGGSLKLCLNIIHFRGRGASQSPLKKKTNTDKFLDSGVKKLVLIDIAFDVQENYSNLRLVFEILQLNNIKFSVAADLKFCNIIVGLQSHASKHPCTWCEACSPFNTKAPLRTLERFKEQVDCVRKAGAQSSKALEFFNCINWPLLEGPGNTPVLDIIPPPELHLMLGVTNHIFNRLNDLWGNDSAIKWAQGQSISDLSTGVEDLREISASKC